MEMPSVQQTETITVQGQQAPAARSHLWAGDHFSFHDLLDALNPLQHIPVIGTIYRQMTGDTIGNAARVAGDGLYGGVIGVIAGLVDVNVLETTGQDIGEHIIATLGGDDEPTAPQTITAGTTNAQTAQAGASTDDPPTPPANPSVNPSVTPPASAAATSPAAAAAAVGSARPSAEPTASAPVGLPIAGPAGFIALSNGPKAMPLDGKPHGFAIDTSPEGILALRATAQGAPRPIALNLPAGSMPPNPRIPVTGAEFVQRMQEGLDKYKALMAQQQTTGAGSAVDQLR
jgi:hypothetical protein